MDQISGKYIYFLSIQVYKTIEDKESETHLVYVGEIEQNAMNLNIIVINFIW